MENHPIPQQISSYQFRLVGDMTLKQFFQVGSGALIAILLYSSGLPFYVKWPLIIISFLIGVALAFFPLEDRPLSKWIFLFAKSVYAPTLYLWMKNYHAPQFFQAESTATTQTMVTAPTVHTPEPEIQQPAADTTVFAPELEHNEQQFLANVTALGEQKPHELTQDIPVEEPVRQEVKAIPETTPITVEKSEKHDDVLFSQPAVQEETPDYQVTPVAGQTSEDIALAQFSPDAAPPSPPTRANVIVGQVMDNGGKIVENAILEVKDGEGRPVRALRSNRLGHFMIVTPLTNGNYQIETEKEGLEFEPVSLSAKGEIIEPIAIRAK